ncbi:MAG: hypothetical protein OER56_08295, partial [Hyphomicrobiales bacterium]|nr:hypothetical protein [Hyphomicrobiales bacterium]
MTAIVKIKHCIWRDGRPRFVPGPAPRKAGLKGKDLRHPSGQWFDLAETQQFSETICQQIKALRSGKSKQRRAPAAYTLSSMVVDGLDHAERQIVDGKRRRQALAPKTVHWYRQMFKVLLDDHSSIMHETQPKDLTFAVIANMLEAIEVKRGLATARGCRAVLSTCWQRIRVVKDLPNNPFRGLDMPAP